MFSMAKVTRSSDRKTAATTTVATDTYFANVVALLRSVPSSEGRNQSFYYQTAGSTSFGNPGQTPLVTLSWSGTTGTTGQLSSEYGFPAYSPYSKVGGVEKYPSTDGVFSNQGFTGGYSVIPNADYVAGGSSLSAAAGLYAPTSTISPWNVARTVELWVRRGSTTFSVAGSMFNLLGMRFSIDNTGKLVFRFAPNLYTYPSGKSTASTEVDILTFTQSSAMTAGWHHLAATVSGSCAPGQTATVKLYVDGTQAYAATVTYQTVVSTYTVTQKGSSFWSFQITGPDPVTGIRIVDGQLLASGNFSPPTSPVSTTTVGWTGANAASSFTGTTRFVTHFAQQGLTRPFQDYSLLTKGVTGPTGDTAAGIGSPYSVPSGSPAITPPSTSQALIFAGNNYLRISPPYSSPTSLNLGSGDFTIEFFAFNPGRASGTGTILRSGIWQYNTAAPPYWGLQITSAGVIGLLLNSTTARAVVTIDFTHWWFVQVRKSGLTYIIQAVSNVGAIVSNSYTAASNSDYSNDIGPLYFGVAPASTEPAYNGTTDINGGQFQDLRITKGVARPLVSTYPSSYFPTSAP
jgi:hypothetical protein